MVVALTGSKLGKKAAASRALEFVRSGMTLGLGTGSTATEFLKLLSDRIIREGLRVLCVPTSKATKNYAERLGIPLTTLDIKKSLDLIVDGADEFDKNLNLIKGGGGALLQEKIVAVASKHMIVITDFSKESQYIGSFDLPVEIVRFGASSTEELIKDILRNEGYQDVKICYRENKNSEKFVTDEGHFILDLGLRKIKDSQRLQDQLIKCTGVVETGLFLDIANTIIVGNSDGSSKLIGASNLL